MIFEMEIQELAQPPRAASSGLAGVLWGSVSKAELVPGGRNDVRAASRM